MKKRAWPLVLTVLWAYGGVALIYAVSTGYEIFYTPVLVWLAGLVVLCLANIVYALCRKTVSALPGMVAKLVLIPFYALVFLVGMIMAIWVPLVLIFFLLDGLLMLTTSAYTLRSLFHHKRAGTLSTGWAIVLAISQCFFVLDVPGSVVAYCLTKEKRRHCDAECASS